MTLQDALRDAGVTAERGLDPPELLTHLKRDSAPVARFPLMSEMIVERGTVDDWQLLHDLHYKAENPPIGPHYWRCRFRGETIGVVVTGVPRGMVRERNQMFRNLRPGSGETRLTNTNRYHYINRHFRVISRFVFETKYRGIGGGTRMLNLVCRLQGREFMEIQSSMSKYNFFAQKAGFVFARPANANNYVKVLKFFRSHFAADPVDYEAILAEIGAKSEPRQARMHETLKEFYFSNSAQENTTRGGDQAERRSEIMTTRDLVRGIQQMGLASPMYGIWRNPDFGRTDLPESLPLTAFDNQGPNERLILP